MPDPVRGGLAHWPGFPRGMVGTRRVETLLRPVLRQIVGR